MNIFFDTEFTGLNKDAELISIGMISENGKSFYAEFIDFNIRNCSDWVKENVIKNLLFNDVTKVDSDDDSKYYSLFPEKIYGDVVYIKDYNNGRDVKNRLTEWLSQFDQVQLISDVCHYDMVLFIDIYWDAFDIPKQVAPCCHDINQDIANKFKISESEAFDMSREELLPSPIEGEKHNSLYDAAVIKAIYDILK